VARRRDDVGKEYPDVTLTHEFVDAAAMKLAFAPASFDVMLTEKHVRRHPLR
jgi:3-isopropylmalate dehydrogenase